MEEELKNAVARLQVAVDEGRIPAEFHEDVCTLLQSIEQIHDALGLWESGEPWNEPWKGSHHHVDHLRQGRR